MLDKLYADRLTQTLTNVKNNPDHWDQSHWHCGTNHCFVGFAEMQCLAEINNVPIDSALSMFSSSDIDFPVEVDSDYFGISVEAFECLVHRTNTLEQLEYFVDLLIENNGLLIIKSRPPVSLRKCLMNGATFDGVDLSYMNFEQASLEDCSFDNCNLTGARFHSCLLVQSSFFIANLTDADFEFARVRDCDFTKATMVRAKLHSLIASYAVFNRADLTGASFLLSTLYGASFSGANITNVCFKDADIDNAVFDGEVNVWD